MQILQEQKSALPPTPANRATEPFKNREVIYDRILILYLIFENTFRTSNFGRALGGTPVPNLDPRWVYRE